MAKLTPFSLHFFACILFTIQPICLVVAFKKTSNVDEFTIKNHRTRMRQNYVVHKALENEASDKVDHSAVAYGSEPLQTNTIPEELPALIVDYANMIRNDITLLDNVQTRTTKRGNLKNEKHVDDSAVAYGSEPLQPNTIPEELPALIVDYANMIRNDITLLDNVQTRTRKRGNLKNENHHGIQDVPCSCEEDGKKLIFLGEDYVPRTLETRYCNEKLCPSPYVCRMRSHNVTVLKRKKYIDELSQEDLPEDLQRRWVAVKKHVTVGCTCSKGYIDHY